MNIGFFDSGLGGVAVLKKALDMGLSENIYYLGDRSEERRVGKECRL